LTLHRSNSCILEKQPIVHFVPFPGPLGEADLVLCVVAIDQVLHDASRFEEVDCLPIGEGVSHRWDAAIGVDCEELGAC
jgi:hypothetical protein